MWAETLEAPDIQDDEHTAKVLLMIPDERRGMAEPMLRGMLSQVRAQLNNDEHYAIYCNTLVAAYEAERDGRHDDARMACESIGIPYEMAKQALMA